ncbi:hypothetical protein ACGFW5_28815 [Streptomyces sp. NPDC048416]|uniref:hypothetical protein n=1 Tax=Streptomyces sp. NPDC048416 TaxID=3365546 RepID=UPI0037154102
MSKKEPIFDGSGDDALPDEIWERFVRDNEQDIRASAPKEPSARARLVTDRLRKEQEAAEAAARGRKGRRRPTGPDGWRTGPVRRETYGRSGSGRRVWAVLGIVLCAVLLLVALNPSRALSLLTGDTGVDDSATAPLPAETAAPTAAPPSFDPDRPTLKEPFRGSPATRYADGAAGLVPPDATAVGGLSKERVATALASTRALLIEADLNPATLRGGSPEAALAIVDPRQQELIDRFTTALARPDKDHDPLTFFTRFDPKEVALVGDVVKTWGRMTFSEAPGGGVAVHADYSFVYPLVRAAPGSTEVARTIVRRTLDVEVPGRADTAFADGKLVIKKYDEDIANTSCDVHDGYIHPQFADETPSGPSPSGATVDPYDRRKDLTDDHHDGCGRATRT